VKRAGLQYIIVTRTAHASMHQRHVLTVITCSIRAALRTIAALHEISNVVHWNGVSKACSALHRMTCSYICICPAWWSCQCFMPGQRF